MAAAPRPAPQATGGGRAPAQWTVFEVAVGLVLLAGAAAAGLLLARRPGLNRLDAAGFLFLPADPSSGLAKELVKLGSLPFLAIGIATVFMVAVFRDWVRALACALAPIVAVLVVEHVAKPMVGRELSGFYTYPSGTVTVTSAIAAAAFLVTPGALRPLIAGLGVIAVVGVSAGVLVLRWHYPTDVMGGICVGAGSVFLIDGLAHVPRLLRSRPDRDRAPPRAPADVLVDA